MERTNGLFVLCEVCIELLCVGNSCVEEDLMEAVELGLSVNWSIWQLMAVVCIMYQLVCEGCSVTESTCDLLSRPCPRCRFHYNLVRIALGDA